MRVWCVWMVDPTGRRPPTNQPTNPTYNHSRRTDLVEARVLLKPAGAHGVEEAERADAVHVGRVLGHLEGHLVVVKVDLSACVAWVGGSLDGVGRGLCCTYIERKRPSAVNQPSLTSTVTTQQQTLTWDMAPRL